MLKVEERTKKLGYVYREAIIGKLKHNYESRSNLIAANFNKVVSSDLSHLRQALIDTGAKLLLTKVSLFKRFLKDIKKDAVLEGSIGSTGLIFVGPDFVVTAKVLYEFAKEHEDFKLLGGFLDDESISCEDLQQIAKLPSRQELIAKSIFAIKSPLIKFRGVLEQLMRKFLLTLLSAKEGKEKEPAGEKNGEDKK